VATIVASLLLPTQIIAAPPDAEAFFEKKVRPILVERCVSCHGAENAKGDMRADSRVALVAGGDRGTAIVPGKPEESLLIRVARHDGELKMPPKKKMPDVEIAILAEWVKLGAPWPDATTAPVPPTKATERPFTPEEKAFWAFQRVRNPEVPAVKNAEWCRNAIDRFILAKIEAAGLKPTAEADKLTLIRRLTFDLTGLPPTLAEIEAYRKDDSPEAYTKVVDRLLASPAYGEKWGRRWLDVARFADSNGMDENLAYANAWRYRDWVIKSFNDNKPYDQFVREQIAGDLYPSESEAERADRLTGTGFMIVGPKMLAEDDPVKMRMDIIDEQLDTIGQAFMGLTLGCARCHDHKFDPITAGDYYGLAGIFYSTKTMQNFSVVARWHERPIANPEVTAALAEHDRKVADAKMDEAVVDRSAVAALGGASGRFAVSLQPKAKLTALEKSRPQVDEVMAAEDGPVQNLRIHLRGSHLTLGVEVARRFPRILTDDNPPSLGKEGSGRRDFAEWLTRPEHPLTARVMANRIWAGHFGNGLVRTPDNFGRLGERPTHPELLDWLAAEFVHENWSIKQMHRLIVTSSTYRMGSQVDPAVFAQDPENRLFTHFDRRRLDAEELRDGMLAVAGLLDPQMGGTLLTVGNRQYVTSTANRNYEGYNKPRRSVYLPVIRSAGYDVLQTFDFPDSSVLSGKRAATTIPTQALLFLNSTLADQTAKAFAESLLALPGDDASRIRTAYSRIFGRTATEREVERVQDYLEKSEQAGDPKTPSAAKHLAAWRGFCRVLFASNEFVFVE